MNKALEPPSLEHQMALDSKLDPIYTSLRDSCTCSCGCKFWLHCEGNTVRVAASSDYILKRFAELFMTFLVID